MARRDAKPMMPAVEQPRQIPCAGNPACRYPGRLWVRTLPHNERLCVIHYYQAIERDYSLAHDDTVPPRENPLRKAA